MSNFEVDSNLAEFPVAIESDERPRPLSTDHDDGDDDAIYSSSSLPVMKDVIRRILRTAALVKTRKNQIEAASVEGEGPLDLQEDRFVIRKQLDLYHFLWARLLRILNDEHERSSDVYTHSLNLQDRMPFESLAHAIHHNTAFCELLGELTSVSVARRPYEHERLSDIQRAIMTEYYEAMQRIQLNATHCALLVVEGSRESFLDPISMFDLCKLVVEEPDRRKRLVPLSLMLSMLDQDEQAVAEALSQGVPRALLQRLRHLVHRLFGHFPDRKVLEDKRPDRRTSPLRYQAAVIQSETNSPIHSRRGSPVRRHSPSLVTNGSANLFTCSDPPSNRQRSANRVDGSPDSPIPVPPSSNGSFPDAVCLTTVNAKCQKRIHSRGNSPALKMSRVCNNTVKSKLWLCSWRPAVGDVVGRGPLWTHMKQGKNCDFGEVVGISDRDEVIVRWIPSEDTLSTAPERLYRYQYRSPWFQVVRWEDFLRIQTMNTSEEDIRLIEFMLICAVVGVLCQQRDTILPALQFQTIESVIKVLDTVDLSDAFQLAESTNEASEMREKARLSEEEEDGAVDEDSFESMLRWDVHLQKVRRTFREARELIARVGWVLNALLSHKKLAILFLDADGIGRVMRIINGPLEVATAYGCAIILAHLAKSSVFEEVLRSHDRYFHPIMRFILYQWEHSPSTDVQGSVAAFIFHSLSFPCALQFFDGANGSLLMLGTLERSMKASEEKYDVIFPGLQLAVLKCLNTYVIAHLMLSTKVIFRKHRVLSAVLTKASPQTSLPRDLSTIDSVLAFLACPSSALQDVSVENVLSLLAPDRLPSLQRLTDSGFPTLLLRCSTFYFIQSRWELLTASLQALCVLTVAPYVRPLVAECHGHDSGIAQLLAIISDLAVSFHNRNASRENHLLPCVRSALHVLINVMTPPAETADEGTISIFNHICCAFRANDGVRTLLEILKIKKDSSLSAKLNFFPIVARAVHLMVVLRRYGDTNLLFEVLGVHRVAQDLLQEYSHVQKEYISMMGPRKLHITDLDPAGRFMENLKCLMPTAFGEAGQPGLVKTHSVDPLEMELRQAIVARAVIDYSPDTLLTLIASHLESEGLTKTADTLRREALLQTSALTLSTGALEVGADKTLDGIVRSYLRQQQEKSPNPIETLPQFDLTKKHLFIPPTAPPDQSRNVFNRLLDRKTGTKFTLRTQINDNCLSYRYPSYMFDITGGDEGLQGESICFCDNGDAIIIGTSEGGIALFDTFPGDPAQEKLLEQHIVFESEGITSVVVSHDGRLVAAVNEAYQVKIMPRDSLPVVRQDFSSCRAIRLSYDSCWSLLTSSEDHTCKLFDSCTQQELRRFNDDRVWSGENLDNVAVFDASSQLILHDAILWDLRCSDKPVFRFDRITESFASAFHPSNQMIIIDEKVWDLRTFRMLQTVPAFQKTSAFHSNRLGKVIYSFRQASLTTATPILSAVDSYSFEVIFSEESQPAFKTFALDPSDRYCAASLDSEFESVIRIFATSSGPFPDHNAFSSPHIEQDIGSDLGDNDEEDEIGEDWSLDDGYDDDEFDEEGEESSASYSGDEDDEATDHWQFEEEGIGEEAEEDGEGYEDGEDDLEYSDAADMNGESDLEEEEDEEGTDLASHDSSNST